MLTQELVIEKIKLFLNELIQNGISLEKAYLYGSYSKNSQNQFSDIDLAIISDMFSGFGFEDRKLFSNINIKKEYLDIETKTIPTKTFIQSNPFIDEIIKTGIEIKFLHNN
jgi:predicted nucleotidyltransferase